LLIILKDTQPEDPPGRNTQDNGIVADLSVSTEDSAAHEPAPSVSVSASDDSEIARMVQEHNAKIKAKTPVKAKLPERILTSL
jgi:hypothetical protein